MWQQLKKHVPKASPHDKMLFCWVFNCDSTSCSANIVWGQLEHVRHPCVKPDLIQYRIMYHVQCMIQVLYHVAVHCMIHVFADNQICWNPHCTMMGSMNVFGSVLESALYRDELINVFGSVLALHCTEISLSTDVFGSVRSIWPMSVVCAWEPRIRFDRIDQIARIITC